METIIQEVDMDLTEIHQSTIPDIPPWTIRTPNINLTLRKFHKTKTHPLIFLEELEKVKERYPKCSHIFTDRSKVEKITGCATVHKGKIFKKKKKHLPNVTSIFSAEDYTINMALELFLESRNDNSLSFLICCQSWNH